MRSWVWQHCTKNEDGKSAKCDICDAILRNHGSTTVLIDHLTKVHLISPPKNNKRKLPPDNDQPSTSIDFESTEILYSESSVSNSIDSTPVVATSTPKKRHRTFQSAGIISKERSETITQALTKMIAINRLPFSFSSSPAFREFMGVVEPNYKCPCSQTIVRRLRILENAVKTKIQNDLGKCQFIALDTDCWSSRSQDGYISINAHMINQNWELKIVNLCTNELNERHTAENLADSIQIIMAEYGIDKKVVSISNDQAANIVAAVNMLHDLSVNVKCAAHKIHTAIRNSLKHDDTSDVIKKGSRLVTHFHMSNIASSNLEQKQNKLGLKELKLKQSVQTRWNTDLYMAESLIQNRTAITSVLTDRSVTDQKTARSLAITEYEWTLLEILVEVLKPLEVASTLLCGGILSMVNPIMRSVINNHLSSAAETYKEDERITPVIKNLITELSNRFSLECNDFNTATVSQKASFLDPRFKDLTSESAPARTQIKLEIQQEIEELKTDETNENHTSASALDFIFKRVEGGQLNSGCQQINLYLAEPEIDMNMEPLEWWKSREKKFPLVSQLAKKYLCIPATSVASERVFSCAGNVVTPRRNCLATNNVETSVFLYQNRVYFVP